VDLKIKNDAQIGQQENEKILTNELQGDRLENNYTFYIKNCVIFYHHQK
jgi:hypothetical protein